jgi:hypothetical protein
VDRNDLCQLHAVEEDIPADIRWDAGAGSADCYADGDTLHDVVAVHPLVELVVEAPLFETNVSN